MKLIIQIPCRNEANQLPSTLKDLPRHVDGFTKVEWLVIDDGSTDGTADVAKALGADHVLRLDHNQGLARAFVVGLEACLRRGADVIVNTDGDNQYRASYIPDLVAPILSGDAQIVIGCRPIGAIAHFSRSKRLLQRFGSWIVRLASGTKVLDAPSGFRAIKRDAAVQLFVFSHYTYTIETIIQAGRLGIPIASIPVEVNGPTRESRLIRSAWRYVAQSASTIFRILVLYKPFRVFAALSLPLLVTGLLAFGRFFYLFIIGEGSGNIQSLVIGSAFIAAGMIMLVGGLIADLIAANRALLAEIRSRLLKADLDRMDEK